MTKIGQYLAVLKDSNGYPVCSLTGDLEFIYKSFSQSVKSAKLDEDVKKLVENGTILFSCAYAECVDDNNVCMNVCIEKQIDIPLLVKNVISCSFGSRECEFKNRDALSALRKVVTQLDKECAKIYEKRRKDFYAKIVDSSKEN